MSDESGDVPVSAESEKELCAQIGHDTARVKAMLNEDSRLSWDGAIWKLAETVGQSNEH